jgi:S-formylglutathione hydrolase FrmB
VLYLLHGLSDDDTAWLRRTSIERYVSELGLAVVMPQVHRSFYSDELHGLRYWTFLSDELPQLVDSFFHVSTRREDTFVAGLSMGGYGALKWALRQPSDRCGSESVRRAGCRQQRAPTGPSGRPGAVRVASSATVGSTAAMT